MADFELEITLKGLRGGHSGLEINEGRGNANKLLARFMNQLIAYYQAGPFSWEGGNMRNAIPREAHALLQFPRMKKRTYWKIGEGVRRQLFNEEYPPIETPISFEAETWELPTAGVPSEIQDNLIDAMFACQNGVMRMIPTVPDTVETSSNLAIVSIGGGKAELLSFGVACVTMKDFLDTALESLFRYGRYEGGNEWWLFRMAA